MLATVALPFCGALFYSTVVYFWLEFREARAGTNFSMVLLVNCPWSIAPLALYYYIVFKPHSKRKMK